MPTITIEVADEVRDALEREARFRKSSVETVAEQVVEGSFAENPALKRALDAAVEEADKGHLHLPAGDGCMGILVGQ